MPRGMSIRQAVRRCELLASIRHSSTWRGCGESERALHRTLRSPKRGTPSARRRVDLDRTKVVQAVTDAATDVTTAEFGAFFYNVVNETGESYTLYTISGAPREAFSQFPMPRNTEVFAPTFKGIGIVRSPDITKDPRYGHNAPHRGMPAGHLPVRSYLSVPVKGRAGEVIGGLFFGHSEVGRFTEHHERLAVGIAAWAAVALENARLYMSVQDASRIKDEFLASLSHERHSTRSSAACALRPALAQAAKASKRGGTRRRSQIVGTCSTCRGSFREDPGIRRRP